MAFYDLGCPAAFSGNQAQVVQKLDSTIQQIRITGNNCVIHWIVIYPLDSAIQRLNNWGLINK